MSVRAPHSSSLLTASVSAAMTAKKRTGMGLLDTLGSAPRSSNSFSVFKRTRCLVRQAQNTIYTDKYTNKISVIKTEQSAAENRRQNWLGFHGSHSAYSLLCVGGLRNPCATQRFCWSLHRFLRDLNVIAADRAGRVKGLFWGHFFVFALQQTEIWEDNSEFKVPP